jgi:hypothetical protein
MFSSLSNYLSQAKTATRPQVFLDQSSGNTGACDLESGQPKAADRVAQWGPAQGSVASAFSSVEQRLWTSCFGLGYCGAESVERPGRQASGVGVAQWHGVCLMGARPWLPSPAPKHKQENKKDSSAQGAAVSSTGLWPTTLAGKDTTQQKPLGNSARKYGSFCIVTTQAILNSSV